MKSIFQNTFSLWEKAVLVGLYSFVVMAEYVWEPIRLAFEWSRCPRAIAKGCSLKQFYYLEHANGVATTIDRAFNAQILILVFMLVYLCVKRKKFQNPFVRWFAILATLAMLCLVMYAFYLLGDMAFMRAFGW